MNTVILSSVLSAGNHALFAGTRVLYGLSVTSPVAQAPRIFSWTTANGVPLPALLATSSVGALCFASSFIGSGELWGWLQNIVGVSNQVRFYRFEPACNISSSCRLRGCLLVLRAGGLGELGLGKEGH
jgi:amino acid permease